MTGFCHTERSRELKIVIVLVWVKIMVLAFSILIFWAQVLLVLGIGRVSYLWAVFGRDSSCFHFSFLVSTPEDHREHTGNWQLFLMRGVCEAASHSEFPALLFSGIRGFGDVFLELFALTANSIITFWQDQMHSGFEFYFRSMPYFAKENNYLWHLRQTEGL